MRLSAEQMHENFDKLTTIISSEFTGDRKDKLLNLHMSWFDRIATAPASTKTAYFNAFPGGYVLHVLGVCKAAALMYDVWTQMQGTLDFTWEELAFVAITHDLGKIGSETEDLYIECTEDWMLRKGIKYVLNPKLQYMKASDRSLMTLSNEGIRMTDKEYLAIKLVDGLYEDSNKAYFMAYNEDYELKTMLPHILHQADLISCKTANKANANLGSKPAPKKEVEVSTVGAKTFSKFFNE
jgi:hypothetical protein